MEHLVFLSHSSKDSSIANAICECLETAGISCWIAPRNIDCSNWTNSILDGLRRSDVLLVIITENSNNSPEVLKEVVTGTHTCRYIFPLLVDLEIPSAQLSFHLKPFQFINASMHSLETHIQKLKEQILNLSDRDTIFENCERRILCSNIPAPKNCFIGRDQEISRIHNMLQQDHIVFLQGMGGIGKSEIAKGYAKVYVDSYDTVILAHYETSILDMIIGEDIKIKNFHRNFIYGEDAESTEHYYVRKMDVLRDLANSRVLLIIDNFDTDYDPHLWDLMGCNCHLIFTSRIEHNDYPTLPVGPISDFEALRSLFLRHCGRMLSEKDLPLVDQLINMVNCHTITIELLAKQLKASFITMSKLITILQEHGINTQLKEKVSHEFSTDSKSAYGFIRNLFRPSSLDQSELQLLQKMCMVPPRGISVSLLAEILELEDYNTINNLLRKSWLMYDESSGALMMHPIICDVVKEELKPDNISCEDYIRGVWKVSVNAWHMDKETRAERWPLVNHILRFHGIPTVALFRQYCDFVNIAWICGQYSQSIAAAKIVYDFSLQHYGINTFEAGFAARCIASAYHNSGDENSAEPYYRISAQHQRNAPNKNYVELAIILGKVGRCAYEKGNFEESRQVLTEALDILLHQNDVDSNFDDEKNPLQNQIANTYVELTRLHIATGEYETALTYCQKGYDFFFSWRECETVSIGYCLSDFGKCYSALGDFQKAENYLLRAISLFDLFLGSTHIDAIYAREALADNYLAMGYTAKAKDLYLQLEFELEKAYGEGCTIVDKLRQKIDGL